MDVGDLFKEIIFEKSVKPVSKVHLKVEGFITLNVKFEDGSKVKFKLDDAIQSFLCIIQNVNFEKKDIPFNACIPSPLNFFKIFGFVENDTARFVENEHELLILFSSSR